MGYAMSAMGCTDMLLNLLTLLFRKIGAGTFWEKQRMLVFHLWICQIIQFPWLDVRMPRRRLNAGIRAWALHRHGYGSPFPREVSAVARDLQTMGVEHRLFVTVPNTPYEIDIAIGKRKDALLVLSETSRNTLDPVGGAVLQLRHLKQHGWRVVVIPRQTWLAYVASSAEEVRHNYLRSLLAVLEGLQITKAIPDAVPEKK